MTSTHHEIVAIGNEKVASASSKLHDELMKNKTNEQPKPIVRRRSDRERGQQTKIQKVPQVLRDEYKGLEKYYDPKWISIGPIHHGNPKFKLAEQKFKFKFAAKFVENSGQQSHEQLYKTIMEKIEVLKECFDEEVLENYFNKKIMTTNRWGGCCSWMDVSHSNSFTALFKTKNQIPYLVLKLLMENCSKGGGFVNKLQNSILMFLTYSVLTPEKYRKGMMVLPTEMPVHLLDFLRLLLLQPTHPQKTKRSLSSSLYHYYDNILGCLLPQQLKYKLTTPPLSLDKVVPPQLNAKKNEDEQKQQTFRSVMDLKAAGINLNPSKSSSLKDIRFSSGLFTADLELPPITVDDSMAPKFLNLIAYEMCPDNTKTKYEVSSYISFLDSLIDYPNDVKELRSSHILHNLLGCDKEVAKLFNEMGKFLVPNHEVYENVINEIEKHYHNKCLTWIAQVLNDHFSTPWTIVTFLAAFLALGMSFIQTYYTIYPMGD
uniref:Uncharacterized protein n=1 Tax=Cannabis sativa TaxID=3483 RepID=A0A803P7E5_CANSA